MDHSIYVHIPFCRHRCSYCDFNTYSGQESNIPAYMQALNNEIRWAAETAGTRIPVHTVFLGGGTPSLVPPDLLSELLVQIRACFDLTPGAEITLEANPGTVSYEGLRILHRAGYNRISFGMQSAHPDDLRLLERQHDFFRVTEAVQAARLAGFDNFSLDLIFGIPGQSIERWQHSLERALGLQPDHLSLYALTIEHGTPFQHYLERGLMPVVDDDLAADMYEWASLRLQQAGFHQYEISNWARQRDGGFATARHNLQYWRGRPYFGFGAGAHGYVAGVRTANVLGINAYIQRITAGGNSVFPASPACVQATRVERWTAMQELMMVGLRLTEEGVAEADFIELAGVTLEQAFPNQIDRLTKAGLLEWVNTAGGRRLRLTPGGRLLGNRVFQEFVGLKQPRHLDFPADRPIIK